METSKYFTTRSLFLVNLWLLNACLPVFREAQECSSESRHPLGSVQRGGVVGVFYISSLTIADSHPTQAGTQNKRLRCQQLQGFCRKQLSYHKNVLESLPDKPCLPRGILSLVWTPCFLVFSLETTALSSFCLPSFSLLSLLFLLDDTKIQK